MVSIVFLPLHPRLAMMFVSHKINSCHKVVSEIWWSRVTHLFKLYQYIKVGNH